MRAFMIVGALTAAAACQAAEGWGVTREIKGEASAATVVAVPLDGHVFANSREHWIDVRVLDRAGREVPRVIQPVREYFFEERHASVKAKLTSVEQLPGGGLSIMCEIERTNALTLTQVTLKTPLRNYEQMLTVLVPGQANTWQPVGSAAPLFDYSRYADVRKDSVELPALTNRSFKLVIGQADDKVFSAYTSLTEESDGTNTPRRLFKRYNVESRPFRVDAVTFRDTERVAMVGKTREERMVVPSLSMAEDKHVKITEMTLDSGNWPLTGLAFDPEQHNFERKVDVECPAPGGWRTLASGILTRSRLPEMAPVERLEISFPETRAERMRVKIYNQDNPPLSFGASGIKLIRPSYEAVFIAEQNGYRLVYGNPEVKAAPVYEQGVLAYLSRGHKAAQWRLEAAPEGAVAYGRAVRVRTLLAKHGMLLTSLAVMAALGVMILRAVRHLKREERIEKS
ncbi:MAG: hypothetical protein PHU80_05690 [Kiritimatiellae bacterium]|nr:hypothetical protein [Kiritimatiellia bacterium]